MGRHIKEVIKGVNKWRKSRKLDESATKKNIRDTCCHWYTVRGKDRPLVKASDDYHNCWKCMVCGAIIPMSEPSATTRTLYPERAIESAIFYGVVVGISRKDLDVLLKARRMCKKTQKTNRVLRKVDHSIRQRRIDEDRRYFELRQKKGF